MTEAIFLGECPVVRPEGVYINGQRVISTPNHYGLGAVERRNPLPPGRYWVDLFPDTVGPWLRWRELNSSSVKVETTEHFDTDPARDFVIFRVSAPVTWEGPGFPSIAKANVTSSEDTGQRPPPEPDVIDQLHDALNLDKLSSDVKTGALVVAGSVIIGGLLYLLVTRRPTSTPTPSTP